ncbi:MAG: oligosaccharide flippase family protein [Bdellovibrionales bacterium]|nr:oligosaccharide flippase family protein [Bdellovibrionales bacterium]
MSEFKSHKALILRNIFWANLNTFLRYALAFAATSYLARSFSPDIFGTYQLVMSYLTIFEAFAFVNPTHLRNYLASNPDKETTVTSLWFWQNIVIFMILFLVCLFGFVFSPERAFWLLLAIASIRFLFRFNDYVAVICDQRLLNHVAQKIAIVQSISLNIARILAAALKANIFLLCFTSPVQGICSTYQQWAIGRKIGIKTSKRIEPSEFLKILKGGFFLSLLAFISVFQSRVISLVIAEYLSKEDFGNFQLVVKLVEPATMLGVIILGANYSVLANTLTQSLKLFNIRFAKIVGVTLMISFGLALIIYLSPVSLLVRFFGEKYLHGLSLLGIGSLMVISNTFFWVDQNYDFLKQEYIFALIKYVAILLLYVCATFYFAAAITIEAGLWISILVPLVVSGSSLIYRIISYFRTV